MEGPEDTAKSPLHQVEDAESSIYAGDLEKASLKLYQAIETAMIQLAKSRSLPHTDHHDLHQLAVRLDEEHGTPDAHFVRFEAARAMYENIQWRFLDLEETLMSTKDAREFIAMLEDYRKQSA